MTHVELTATSPPLTQGQPVPDQSPTERESHQKKRARLGLWAFQQQVILGILGGSLPTKFSELPQLLVESVLDRDLNNPQERAAASEQVSQLVGGSVDQATLAKVFDRLSAGSAVGVYELMSMIPQMRALQDEFAMTEGKPESFSAVLEHQLPEHQGKMEKPAGTKLIIRRAIDGNYDYIADDQQHLEKPDAKEEHLVGLTDEGKAVVFSVAEAADAFPAKTIQDSMTKYLAARKVSSAFVPNNLYDVQKGMWTESDQQQIQKNAPYMVITREGRLLAVNLPEDTKQQQQQAHQLTSDELKTKLLDPLEAFGVRQTDVVYVAEGNAHLDVVLGITVQPMERIGLADKTTI